MKMNLIWVIMLLVCVRVDADTGVFVAGTKPGMSLEEVQSVFSDSYIVDVPGTLAGGALELLRVDNYDVVGESFKIRFYFKGEKLVQVTLNLNNERSFSASMLIYDRLVIALRSKYGNEISRGSDINSLAKRARATWVNGNINISLLLSSVGNRDALLNLNYQTRIAEDADKL